MSKVIDITARIERAKKLKAWAVFIPPTISQGPDFIKSCGMLYAETEEAMDWLEENHYDSCAMSGAIPFSRSFESMVTYAGFTIKEEY